MEIKLQRVGGFLPITKEASAEVGWSDDELQKLIQHIRVDEKTDTKSRDITSHYLEVKGEAIPVNLQKLPKEYRDTFDELKANLKPVKS